MELHIDLRHHTDNSDGYTPTTADRRLQELCVQPFLSRHLRVTPTEDSNQAASNSHRFLSDLISHDEDP